MILLAALGLASAQAPEEDPIDYSEIVLVWPDKFARWQDTRWWVGMELLYPLGLELAAETNQQFRTVALQAKAIVACNQNYKLGGKRIEVGCKFEDVSLQATSLARFKTDKDKALVQKVLDELDASLTGATVQVQTNERGAITNIDLEGFDTDNLRLRKRAETMRQIVARLMYPFHMKLPKSGVREGQWVEFDSDLMTMPSSTGVTGSSMIVHYMNYYKGYLLVQDIGNGQVQAQAPEQADWKPNRSESEVLANDSEDAQWATNPGFSTPESVFEVPLGYKLHLDGVSIFNVDNGVMEERVWSMSGEPVVQNPSNLKLWYSGRIKLLGDDDKPDLGKTGQVGYPGAPIPGLPRWLPVDPEMAKGLDVPLPVRQPSTKKKKK